MTNTTPKISVVMAVYNGEKYLRDAVESVLNQTYGDFEFLIIDDASTDRTAEILSQFSDPRIRVYRNVQNEGLTRCLIKGCNEARGKYIARMDADDISYPLRFEKQVEFLENHPDYAVVGVQCHFLDSKGKARGTAGFPCSSEEIKQALRICAVFAHGGTMFTKQRVMDCGGYREFFRYSQDYDLWLRVIEKHRMANLPDVLYGFRFHRASTSHQKLFLQIRFAEVAQKFAHMRAETGSDSIMNDDIANMRGEIENWHPKRLLQRMRIYSDSKLQRISSMVYWAGLWDISALWLGALFNNPLNEGVWKFLFSDVLRLRLKRALKNRIYPRNIAANVCSKWPFRKIKGFFMISRNLRTHGAWQFHLLYASGNMKKFFSGIPFFRYVEYPAVAGALEMTNTQELLDVGSGASIFPFLLACLGHKVVCVDKYTRLDPEILRKSMVVSLGLDESISQRVAFSKQDARALQYADKTFDKISCISVIEHVPFPDDIKVIVELARVLKDGGKIVLTFPYHRTFREAREPYDVSEGHRLYDERAVEERIVRPSGLRISKNLYFVNIWFDFEKFWLRLPISVQNIVGFISPVLSNVFIRTRAELGVKSANGMLLVLEKPLRQEPRATV